jgi:sarcosine oxidase subunit alpha
MRREPDLSIEFEGESVPAVAGEPVAVALLAHGTRVLSRSIKYHRPRSFFCLSGHCGACLMRIDGVPNEKSCMVPARAGQKVERQNAFPSGGFDVLGAADFFFPKGMDHHTLMTSSRALNAVMKRVVREVGGLGRVPDDETLLPPAATSTRRHVDVVVVGGGAAGLSAAIGIARKGGRGPAAAGARSIVVLDEASVPGGSLLGSPAHGPAAAQALVHEATALGVEIRSGAAAFGYYPEDEGGVLGVDDRGALLRLSAKRYVYATGGYDTNELFADNDRPGICAARAVGKLLLQHGFVPATRPLVLGKGAYADALAGALEATGLEVSRVLEAAWVRGASGTSWVSGLDVADGVDGGVNGRKGRSRRIACDLVAVAATPAPASELLRMHGAEVRFSDEKGGFAAEVDVTGRTCVEGVYAVGDVCGYLGPEASLAAGARIAEAVVEGL